MAQLYYMVIELYYDLRVTGPHQHGSSEIGTHVEWHEYLSTANSKR